MTNPSGETRCRRNRSIWSAVLTSLLSKGSTSILQFVSLPLAARVLGREEFGVFSTISLAVFAVGVLQFGVGPALASGIAEASARGDRKREGQLFVNGFVLVAALAVLGFMVTGLLLATVPIAVLFGAEYAPHVELMRLPLWIGAALMLGHVIVAMIDRVREGYMEARIVNTWSAVGNLGGAIAVIVGIRYFPTVSFLLVAVSGPNILARLLNAAFLLSKRPWLLAKCSVPRRKTMGLLIWDGFSFSATSFAVYLSEFVACALIVGRMSGPRDVAVFQIMMSVATAFLGLVEMVGKPLWAAIVDAKIKGDHAWMTSAIIRYYGYLACLCVIAGTVLVGLGPWLVPLVYGAEFTVEWHLFASHVGFLFAIGWRHVNRYLAIGFGQISKTVFPILAGLVIGLVLGVIGLASYGLWALFAGLAVGTIFIPGLILPRLVLRQLRQYQPNRVDVAAALETSG